MQSIVDQSVKVNGRLIGKWRHYASRKQLIVICHGYEGTSEDPTISVITNGLNKLGHDTFTFNFTQSTGGFDIEHQVNDITQILEYFNDYNEIILLAHSLAALTAAVATIHAHKVKGLITLNGFFGRRNLGKEHFRNYAKFRIVAYVIPKYGKILKYFKRELQPDRIEVPVLVIHSKADKYVFIKQSQAFYETLTSPKRFVELETATHGITSSGDRRKVISQIHTWITEAIGQ